MDPRFFLDLTVEPGVELALRPSSSAPYETFSLSVEPASLVSGAWLAGLISSTILVGSGTLAADVGSGAGGALVVVRVAETAGVGPGLVAAGLRGAVSGAVGAGETTLRSVSTGNSEGKPSTG
jgi:hypothetical protein